LHCFASCTELARLSLGANGTKQTSLVVFSRLQNSHFAITSERMPPRMKSICQLDVIMEATLDDYDWKTLDVVLGK
ncbi:hypothetical protein T4B_6511, partial [Trichinella pseudospiralis]